MLNFVEISIVKVYTVFNALHRVPQQVFNDFDGSRYQEASGGFRFWNFFVSPYICDDDSTQTNTHGQQQQLLINNGMSC